MDLMMTRLQEWVGKVHSVEGRLAGAASALMDSFVKMLKALEGQAELAPQEAAVIKAGLGVVQEAVRTGHQVGDGWWSYWIERFSPAGSYLTLRRDPPGMEEIGFQIDLENRLHGIFYLHTGDIAAGRDDTFYLKQISGKWVLVKWDDVQETHYPLAGVDGSTLWNLAPKIDFWDELIPSVLNSRSSWQARPEKTNQPEKRTATPGRLDIIDGSYAATIILKQAERIPSLTLVFDRGGKEVRVAGSMKIGRDKDNDLVLEDSEVSRFHAVIELMPGGWIVRDLNSTNGTWLNNSRVKERAAVKVGDKLRIGRTRLTIESQS